jgi:hypothetical protein
MAERGPSLPPPPGPGGLLGTLLSVVASIRSWQQLAILLVLAVALGLGILAYEARPTLLRVIERVLTGPPGIELASDAVVQDAATKLAAQLDPVAAVIVWRVDLIHNRRVVVGLVVTPPLTAALPELRRGEISPLLMRTPGANGTLLAAVLDGEVGCGPPTALRTVYGDGLDVLLPIACVAGVPPTADALVGVVAVGFAAPLMRQREESVKATLRAVAEGLVVTH